MVPSRALRLGRFCRSVPGHHGADAPKPERKKSLTKGEQLISERQKSNGEAKLRRKKSGDGERRKSSRDAEGERKNSVDEAEDGALEDSTPRPQQSGATPGMSDIFSKQTPEKNIAATREDESSPSTSPANSPPDSPVAAGGADDDDDAVSALPPPPPGPPPVDEEDLVPPLPLAAAPPPVQMHNGALLRVSSVS